MIIVRIFLVGGGVIYILNMLVAFIAKDIGGIIAWGCALILLIGYGSALEKNDELKDELKRKNNAKTQTQT